MVTDQQLSALVVTTGPVVTPFFLGYGLRRGAFIATEAMCAGAMHVTRGLVFARYRMISGEILIIGLVLSMKGMWPYVDPAGLIASENLRRDITSANTAISNSQKHQGSLKPRSEILLIGNTSVGEIL